MTYQQFRELKRGDFIKYRGKTYIVTQPSYFRDYTLVDGESKDDNDYRTFSFEISGEEIELCKE